MKLNSVIIADDSETNGFFSLLKNSTIFLLHEYSKTSSCKINSIECTSASVDKANISEKIALVNDDKFLCCWYAHGRKDALLMDGDELVTNKTNHYSFSNAIIYTFSCLNGDELADTLIKNNAKVFVGYEDKANYPLGLDEVTKNIVMSFIHSIIDGKTIGESLNDLKNAYDKAVHDSNLEPFQRRWFQANRDSLVLKGDNTITISEILR